MIIETAYPPEKQQPIPSGSDAGSSSQVSREVMTPWINSDQDISGLPPPPAYDSDGQQVSFMRAPTVEPSPYFQQPMHGVPNPTFNGPLYPPQGQYLGSMSIPPEASIQRSTSWSPSPVGYNQMPTQPGGPHYQAPQPLAQSSQVSHSQNRSQHFAPFSILSIDANLEHGFPGSKPSSRDHPHPFTTHDVKQEDWMKFLREVQDASKATVGDQVVNGLTYTVGRLPIAAGLLSLGLDLADVKSKKSAPVGKAITRWNQEYFHPRMMEVVLARGRTCYTGDTKAIPADMQPYHRSGNPDSWSSDDSYSLDEDNGRHRHDDVSGGGILREARSSHQGFRGELRGEFGMDLGGRKSLRDARRAERKEWKAHRKSEKRERRAMKRESRQGYLSENGDRWRLIVAFKPKALV